jgi:hypothetical protein
MRPGLDIERIADSLLRSMPGMQRVAALQATGEFRVAGPIPDRALLVCYEPPGVQGWDFQMTLERSTGEAVAAQPTPYPILGYHWCDIYAVGLAWLVPESAWPHGVREFKVTRRQINELLPDGAVQPHPLMPGQPLPESLRGYYRLPAAGQSVLTGSEPRVLEQLRTWVAMGWRVRDL